MPLTDIVVADSKESQRIAESLVPCETWPGIDAKGIDHVKLGRLLSILTGEQFNMSVIDEFTLLQEASDDGPWVYQIPHRLIDHLARLDIHELDGITNQWSLIEEFSLDAWPPDVVASVLSQLHSLAGKAKDAGKDLLMWVSL
jgi:hypothetical protein